MIGLSLKTSVKTTVSLKHLGGGQTSAWLTDCLIARDYWSRMRGMIGKRQVREEEGILFPSCNNVHMWFMSVSIDILFLSGKIRGDSAELTVLAVHQNVRPWRLLPIGSWRAQHTLEIKAGGAARVGLKPGDVLCIG